MDRAFCPSYRGAFPTRNPKSPDSRPSSAGERRWRGLEATLALHRLEPLVPRRPDPVEPRLDLGQSIRVELVDALLTGGLDAGEPCLTQHPQVLRHCGRRDGEST